MIAYSIDEVQEILDTVLADLRANYPNEITVNTYRTDVGISLTLSAERKPDVQILTVMYAIRPTVVRASVDKRSNVIGYLNTEDKAYVYVVENGFVKIPISTRWGWVDTKNLAPYSDEFDPDDPILNLDTDILIPLYNKETGERYTTQYISLKDIGYRTKHYNLCGEFCVAALAYLGIEELCQSWIKGYAYADKRLKNDEGTSIYDISFMLKSVGLDYDVETFSPSTKPLIANDFAHKKAIVGVGINNSGKILEEGKIRHWVVVLGCVVKGTTGFVRVYNPFYNKEELVDFRLLYKSMCPRGLGTTLIWV